MLNVLIVGCGNIAGNLDGVHFDKKFPVTHAGAYSSNTYFKIVGCVDTNKNKSKYFADTWNIPNTFNSINEAINSNINFDVISICSPTSNHYNDVMDSLLLSPKLIFCEKPVTESLLASKKLKLACEKADVLLAVNYLRRWDDALIKLKDEIESKKYGNLHSIVCYYNKGLLNNGSHMLDLLSFLFGNLELKYSSTSEHDFFDNDPSINAVLETPSSIPISLVVGAPAKKFSIFEMQMIFDKSMICMRDGGLKWSKRKVKDSKIFEGYKVLGSDSVKIGSYKNAMSNAINNIRYAITKGDPLNSNIDNAISSQKICEKILKESN